MEGLLLSFKETQKGPEATQAAKGCESFQARSCRSFCNTNAPEGLIYPLWSLGIMLQSRDFEAPFHFLVCTFIKTILLSVRRALVTLTLFETPLPASSPCGRPSVCVRASDSPESTACNRYQSCCAPLPQRAARPRRRSPRLDSRCAICKTSKIDDFDPSNGQNCLLNAH